MSVVAVNQNLLEAAVSRLGEDDLTALRETALARFAETGFPSVRHEDWRYTNLTPAVELSNSYLAVTPKLSSPPDFNVDGLNAEIDAHWIVISNGIADPEAIAQLQGDGITITSLSESADSVQIHIGDPLSSFNAALLSDGLLIRVAENAQIERPIGFLFVDDAAISTGLSLTRILIDMGRNSSASFVEMHQSSGDYEHLANSIVQMEFAAGASVDFVRIQARSTDHMQIGRLLAQLHEDTTFNFTGIDLGGKLIRNDVVINIAGPGAEANICGVYLADGRQHIDNHILIDHKVGPARSMQNYRGIVGGRARCVFNGKALVREGADGTDAEQSNHNLLLSDTAEVDTKPELEIFADDVKCSHGTTVGQLDPSALFYLRSRGLSHDQAKVLLTRAFAGQILRQLPIEGVKNTVDQMIERKLDTLTESTNK